MPVEEAVAGTLRGEGGETVRLYVAGCAERMAPLFLGLQGGGPDREAHLDFYAGLWEASVEAGRERLRAVLGRTSHGAG
ncbi:hypothetical protein J7F03_31035 [Streptomyces sp. ISL-43]|uniref:hypothetical protein n=1 Tax=Streptomyces sp. ISL-43 TaxID=2819183 RepID=UPI001BE82EF4|nr:hypothetical protein [Streptomyces sp. ISL-43]MBT2451422.1 hypothetical protein [Streptomyces sp. ISL-43]